MSYKYECEAVNARRIADWMQNRGGILLWRSINLSDPGRTITTPYNGPDGVRVGKPSSMVSNSPQHITEMSDVGVYTAKEVKRFHVGVRMGAQGFCLKVTDGGTRRIEREVDAAIEKYGSGWYEFDYDAHENAVIMTNDKLLPMAQWLEENK